MEIFAKIAVCSMISVILLTALKSQNKELSTVLSLAAGTVLLLCGMQLFQSVFSYLHDLRESAGLSSTIFTPLLKACGTVVLMQISVAFCTEAGESAVGKIVELCGGAAAICAMLPLVDAVTELVRGLMGG